MSDESGLRARGRARNRAATTDLADSGDHGVPDVAHTADPTTIGTSYGPTAPAGALAPSITVSSSSSLLAPGTAAPEIELLTRGGSARGSAGADPDLRIPAAGPRPSFSLPAGPGDGAAAALLVLPGRNSGSGGGGGAGNLRLSVTPQPPMRTRSFQTGATNAADSGATAASGYDSHGDDHAGVHDDDDDDNEYSPDVPAPLLPATRLRRAPSTSSATSARMRRRAGAGAGAGISTAALLDAAADAAVAAPGTASSAVLSAAAAQRARRRERGLQSAVKRAAARELRARESALGSMRGVGWTVVLGLALVVLAEQLYAVLDAQSTASKWLFMYLVVIVVFYLFSSPFRAGGAEEARAPTRGAAARDGLGLGLGGGSGDGLGGLTGNGTSTSGGSGSSAGAGSGSGASADSDDGPDAASGGGGSGLPRPSYFSVSTVYVVWLLLATVYHLPPLSALGIDLRISISVFLTILIATFTALLLFRGVYALAGLAAHATAPRWAAGNFAPQHRLKGPFSVAEVWLAAKNALLISLACCIAYAHCGNEAEALAGSVASAVVTSAATAATAATASATGVGAALAAETHAATAAAAAKYESPTAASQYTQPQPALLPNGTLAGSALPPFSPVTPVARVVAADRGDGEDDEGLLELLGALWESTAHAVTETVLGTASDAPATVSSKFGAASMASPRAWGAAAWRAMQWRPWRSQALLAGLRSNVCTTWFVSLEASAYHPLYQALALYQEGRAGSPQRRPLAGVQTDKQRCMHRLAAAPPACAKSSGSKSSGRDRRVDAAESGELDWVDALRAAAGAAVNEVFWPQPFSSLPRHAPPAASRAASCRDQPASAESAPATARAQSATQRHDENLTRHADADADADESAHAAAGAALSGAIPDPLTAAVATARALGRTTVSVATWVFPSLAASGAPANTDAATEAHGAVELDTDPCPAPSRDGGFDSAFSIDDGEDMVDAPPPQISAIWTLWMTLVMIYIVNYSFERSAVWSLAFMDPDAAAAALAAVAAANAAAATAAATAAAAAAAAGGKDLPILFSGAYAGLVDARTKGTAAAAAATASTGSADSTADADNISANNGTVYGKAARPSATAPSTAAAVAAAAAGLAAPSEAASAGEQQLQQLHQQQKLRRAQQAAASAAAMVAVRDFLAFTHPQYAAAAAAAAAAATSANAIGAHSSGGHTRGQSALESLFNDPRGDASSSVSGSNSGGVESASATPADGAAGCPQPGSARGSLTSPSSVLRTLASSTAARQPLASLFSQLDEETPGETSGARGGAGTGASPASPPSLPDAESASRGGAVVARAMPPCRLTPPPSTHGLALSPLGYVLGAKTRVRTAFDHPGARPRFLPMVSWFAVTSADIWQSVFDIIVSFKLFLGRFDRRSMQAALAPAAASAAHALVKARVPPATAAALSHAESAAAAAALASALALAHGNAASARAAAVAHAISAVGTALRAASSASERLQLQSAATGAAASAHSTALALLTARVAAAEAASSGR